MISKRMMFAVFLALFSISVTSAQSKLKQARKYMDKLNYIGAIELYNKVLEKNDYAEAKINLAECYRKVNDPENAEYWYGQVVRLPEAEPVHKLFYGQMLQRNGKCDLAKEWYEMYVREVPDDLRGQFLVKACDYEDELMTKNAGIYEINHLEINSNLDDFSPVIYKDGVVFASERDKGSSVKREHCWTGNPFLELYHVDAEKSQTDVCISYEFKKPKKFSNRLNSKFHDAAVSFSDDEQTLFFTRNNFLNGKTGKDDDGIVKLKVYSAKANGDNWGDLEGLPFNSDEYSVAHPTVTPDGNRLFFASDMPGGFGGMDLYVSEQESGRWGPPQNLGPMVNTEGNEIFPYYQKTGKLFFSSDGQIGLGGLDIYQMEDKDNGEWGMIENLGYPINTISDDFGIVFNDEGTNGFFSSDREGGAGRDDIYSFCKTSSPVEIYVFDAETEEPIAGASVINDCTGNTLTTGEDGKVTIDMKMNECCNFLASMESYTDNEKEGCTTNINIGDPVFVEIPLSKESEFEIEGIVYDQGTGLPLDGAMVTLTNDCDETEEETLVTDATGKYYFKLKEDCCYKVKASKSGYFGNPVDGQCTRGLTEATTLQANLNLAPTVVNDVIGDPNETITRDPLNPNDPKNPLTPDGLPCNVYKDVTRGMYIDANTGEPADGPCGGLTYKGGECLNCGTDTYVGTPSTDPTTTGSYSPNTAGAYNKETGVTSSPTFESSGTTYGDNSAAYLLHIYYDFDQSYIRDESESELQKLCTMMKENSDLIVEIASHTDSRGSNTYNRRLSQRRAESVVRWLCDCGIEKERLIPRGYGETKNVNQCANSVPCSEKEHQLNRRTEFRVIGCLSCLEQQETQLSQPKSDPRVDECVGCPF